MSSSDEEALLDGSRERVGGNVIVLKIKTMLSDKSIGE